jgi:hypothetical protein
MDQPQQDGCPIQSVARNELGQLVVRLRGRQEPVVDARVARCFPWSLPQCYISLRDKEGKELALLKSLEEVPQEHRPLLEQELADKIFNPRISRILDYRNEFGVISVTAQTDRGQVSFQIRSRDDVRLLTPTRALFRDVDGNTYDLPDVNQLDLASRRHLQEYF